MNSASPVWLLVFVSILNGIGAGAASFVPWTLLPDLPDSDEMITGQRNAGVYAGMSTFVRKSTSGVAIFLVGVILSLFGYAESAAGQAVTQTSSALLGVRLMFTALPLLLSAITIWLGFRYTLTKGNHAAVRAAIDHKRESGRPVADAGIRKACETVAGRDFASLWAGKPDDFPS
jgi:oligogalacturonide transporter